MDVQCKRQRALVMSIPEDRGLEINVVVALVAGLLCSAKRSPGCESGPCQNGGRCLYRSTQISPSQGRYVCDCPLGFSGQYCEKGKGQDMEKNVDGKYDVMFGQWSC